MRPDSLRRYFGRLAEPKILFPAIAALVLAIVWGTTLHLIDAEIDGSRQAALKSTLQLANTYEAQMLRNLREIDQTLRVVKYAYEADRNVAVLTTLRRQELLPPDLFFVISISDAAGRIIASTKPSSARSHAQNLQAHRTSPGLLVSRPWRGADSEEWQLQFSRGIATGNGRFDGVVSLTVDAAYFVSDYDKSKLGENGVLGLLGTADGRFRVMRVGDRVSGADSRPEARIDLEHASLDDTVEVTKSPWDGVTRFTGVRPMYGFPLSLIVGVSEEEQLAATRGNANAYVLRALMGSLLLVAFIGLLGNASWKLAETAKRENEAKLAHAERVEHLAYRDDLTGLPNRAYFGKALEQAISHARRYERSLAILFLDLDRFKQINDTLGHPVGDRLLQEIARRLERSLRASDTVARLGGDEFVVLLPEFEEDRFATQVAQKLLNVVSQPFSEQGQSLIGTTSIGIAVFPRDGEDEETLMKHADAAMYHAKAQGKNNFQFYSQSLQVNSLKKLKLETSLRQAIERQEFELHYQPKVSLNTGRMIGMEALIRWRSPEHGMVSPVEFIPIAEDTGLIVPIGKWVLESACAQNVAWQRRGLPGLCVAVNLSGRQFADEGLLDDITEILDRTGLDPSLLELEITESMLMHNVDRAIRTLNTLSEMKIRLAIDDFGTGYSSLSNLRRFPLHTLKIDRSFVRSLPADTEDGIITSAIISMAKALGLTVVAEGVEAAEQKDFLRSKGCDEYQGYFFSKPVPKEEFGLLLERASIQEECSA